jgi:hypothetical protein
VLVSVHRGKGGGRGEARGEYAAQWAARGSLRSLLFTYLSCPKFEAACFRYCKGWIRIPTGKCCETFYMGFSRVRSF